MIHGRLSDSTRDRLRELLVAELSVACRTATAGGADPAHMEESLARRCLALNEPPEAPHDAAA